MLEMMAMQASDRVPEDGEAGVEFGGGYFVRRMKDEAGDWYALVVSPAAEGSNNGNKMRWQPAMDYAASLTIDGHSDWKLMTLDEARIVYRDFNPITTINDTSVGGTDKVEPPLGNYTMGNPSQTSLADWQTGGPEAFISGYYWMANHLRVNATDYAYRVTFMDGAENFVQDTNSNYVRAVRRHYI